MLRYTKRDKFVYAIVLSWPQNDIVNLGALDSKTVSAIQLLGVNSNLTFSASGSGTSVTFPRVNPDSNMKTAYTLKITPK
jgi:hypothetical protein